jgi:UDP-N-acetyl-D-mannosaminuronic acid dehydrogenase
MIKQKETICIIGMGFVGLTLALTLAKKGFSVIGIDKNKKIINLLKSGKAHFYEPGINLLLKRNLLKKKIFFFQKLKKIKNVKTYIITVGTPIDKNKRIITRHIELVSKDLNKILENNDLVILRSTVGVGVTRKIVFPILNSIKKKIYLSFCPERTLEGKALRELIRLPQIISGIDQESLRKSKKIFSKLTKKIISVTDLETAELIKLVDNSNRDVYFAYANEIARICDSLGVSASEVIEKGKKDYPRTNLPLPGLVGGPCLEKDPYIMTESSMIKKKIVSKITIQARHLNENLPVEIVNYIKKFLIVKKFDLKSLKILLMGIAFKGFPKTNDTRGTVARLVIKQIMKTFITPKIYGFDPAVNMADIKKLKIKPVKNFNSNLKKMNLIIILNNNPYFKRIKMNKFYNCNNLFMIYDFWSNISQDSKEFKKNKFYISLGNHKEFRINE